MNTFLNGLPSFVYENVMLLASCVSQLTHIAFSHHWWCFICSPLAWRRTSKISSASRNKSFLHNIFFLLKMNLQPSALSLWKNWSTTIRGMFRLHFSGYKKKTSISVENYVGCTLAISCPPEISQLQTSSPEILRTHANFLITSLLTEKALGRPLWTAAILPKLKY